MELSGDPVHVMTINTSVIGHEVRNSVATGTGQEGQRARDTGFAAFQVNSSAIWFKAELPSRIKG